MLVCRINLCVPPARSIYSTMGYLQAVPIFGLTLYQHGKVYYVTMSDDLRSPSLIQRRQSSDFGHGHTILQDSR